MLHFREYPLLNTPHLVVVTLKAAAAAAVSAEDCARSLWDILARAGENPPVTEDEVLGRINVLLNYLAEARLVAPAAAGRFAITPRGQEALRLHPAGLDTADLMQYPEFASFIAHRGQPRRPTDARAAEYHRGFSAYWSGLRPTENPNPADSADHLAWENGWFEGLDEDYRAP